MPNIVNMKYADLGTARALGTHSQLGLVCKVTAHSDGNRALTPLLDTDDALVVSGNYAVAMKFDTDANEVDSSTAPAVTGLRTVSITAEDLVVECRKGTVIEYAASELAVSLDPGNGGTLPVVGADLGIAGAKWSTIAAATSSGIATPVVGRCHRVFGTGATAKVQVELVY